MIRVYIFQIMIDNSENSILIIDIPIIISSILTSLSVHIIIDTMIIVRSTELVHADNISSFPHIDIATDIIITNHFSHMDSLRLTNR